MYKMTVLGILIVSLCLLSGCAVSLPFNNRMDYSKVSEAKRLFNSKNQPISIEWAPADFATRVDIQGASGFVGGGSQTRIPTGLALSSRIIEALDNSIGVSPNSKRNLEIYVLDAQSKFEYSAGMSNITPAIDYGWCSLQVEFDYNGTKWTEQFVSEEKDPTIGGLSQTGLLEKVWDNIALEVAKNVVKKIEQSPSNENYKDTEQYRMKKAERRLQMMQKYNGFKALEAGDYSTCIAETSTGISVYPEFYHGYSNRSICYSKLFEYDNAFKDANKAIELKPDYPNAYAARAEVYLVKEAYDKALADLNTAITLNPDFAYAYYIRGKLYYNQKNIEAAKQDIRKAATLGNPKAKNFSF